MTFHNGELRHSSFKNYALASYHLHVFGPVSEIDGLLTQQ